MHFLLFSSALLQIRSLLIGIHQVEQDKPSKGPAKLPVRLGPLYQLSIADLQRNYIVHGPRCVSTVNEYGEPRPIEQRGSALLDHIIAERRRAHWYARRSKEVEPGMRECLRPLVVEIQTLY